MIIYENNDILAAVKTDCSVIPSHSLTFAENALYIAEAVESEFNALFESIGIEELAVYESTGSQIIYEGERLNSFKESVIKWVTKIWEKIKGAYEKVIKEFEELRKKSVKNLGKLEAKDVDAYKKDNFGKVNTFNNLENNRNLYEKNARAYFDEIEKKFNELVDKNAPETEIKEETEKMKKNVNHKVSGLGSKDKEFTVSDMQKKIREELLGEQVTATKDYVKNNLTDMWNNVQKGTEKAALKQSYGEARKYFDTVISIVNKYDDNHIRVANVELGVMEDICMSMNIARNTVIDIYKKRYYQHLNILAKVAMHAGKLKDGAKEDITSLNDSCQYDKVSSLFDF